MTNEAVRNEEGLPQGTPVPSEAAEELLIYDTATGESIRTQFLDIEKLGTTVFATIRKSQLSEDDNLEEFGHELILLVEKFKLTQLIIDMARVQYITSAAIGRLIAFHRRMNRDKSVLVLCQLKGTVREILATSQLLSYFRVAATRQEAVELLASSV